jgi:glucuronate isomerase
MAFIHDNFLFENNTAEELYHRYAAELPIFDYHCHLNAADILKNENYPNITRVWLDDDHYKWRLMRAAGIEEKYVTGDGGDYEKFLIWAEVLGTAVGNPLYHWTHLELKRYFGIDDMLNKRTAPSIWERCNERLAEEAFRSAAFLERAKVKGLCTIDDPADDLKSHGELEQRPDIRFRVLSHLSAGQGVSDRSPGLSRMDRQTGTRFGKKR